MISQRKHRTQPHRQHKAGECSPALSHLALPAVLTWLLFTIAVTLPLPRTMHQRGRKWPELDNDSLLSKLGSSLFERV